MAEYETIEVKTLSGSMGAEIIGIDWSKPLSNQQRADVHKAFLDHLMIFFRNQTITPQQQVAVARQPGSDLATDVLDHGVGVGRAEAGEDRAHGVEQVARVLERFEGVLEGRWLGVVGDGVERRRRPTQPLVESGAKM